MVQGLTVKAKGDSEIVMTRAFKAPRVLVFDMLTTPEAVERWLGMQGGWTMPVCEIDLEVGGAYRFVWRSADGKEMGVSGVIREIAPPGRIAWTEKFDEAWYPGEALVTHELAEAGGTTTLETTVRYESTEARDGVLAHQIESGVAASYTVLDGILAAEQG